MAKYYFSGIGGIGMSALAQILNANGHEAVGSDRNFDRNQDLGLFSKLKNLGIDILPQDGTGIKRDVDNVVVSSAIEDSNPDVKAAKALKVPIVTRAGLLAEIFNAKFGIAIGGSNGKTSVTAMTGWILEHAGFDPTIMVGGYIKNHVTERNPGNARTGKSKFFVIEADESDGSIVNYKPNVSVLTGISKDHKTIEELTKLFNIYAENTTGKLIVNNDCSQACKLVSDRKNIISYGISNKADIMAGDIKDFSWGSSFCVNKETFKLNLPGRFNISNALAAISIANSLGISFGKASEALEPFKGVCWRMDIIGTAGNIKVIYDYAHNPEKIKSAIDALRYDNKRLIAVFQPHGYTPTRFFKDELITAFKTKLSGSDILIMPEIYYAGGTADKDISSNDIVEELKTGGINSVYFLNRLDIIDYIKTIVQPNDNILVMGARDNTLNDFSHQIMEMIKIKN